MDTQSIWKHVSKLSPKLRGDVQLYPQEYRAQRWYVLHDQSSGQYLRFNEHAYALLGRLDGNLTLEEILEYANKADDQRQFTQEEVIALVSQLNAAEVLIDGLPINVQDVFGQYKTQQRKKRQNFLMNPFSIKIPLFDPDKLLTRLSPLARILFSKVGFLLWFLTFFVGVLLAVANFEALISDISAMEFSSTQLISLWLIYPIVKILHEFGHGLAVKAWGSEVHEVGINLLVFMPIPYIDTTASWGFRNKWRRMVVGAAGIFVELFIAVLALFLWLGVEPGFVKQAALNVMLISTFSTLLFNGNPLLRFDGYFVLEDWLEIPNLATRAKKYYYYLVQKYILKISDARTPVTAIGERKWFVFYGFASPVYRLVILLSIVLYLVDHFLAIGIVLAIWVISKQLIIPLVQGVLFLTTDERVAPKRSRGIGLVVALVLGFIAILLIPIPTVTYTQGVVWSGEGSQVTAKTSGFVLNPLVSSGELVQVNQPVVQLKNSELTARHKVLQAKLDELNAKSVAQYEKSRVKVLMAKDDLHVVKTQLAHISKQIDELTIKSHADGEFVISDSRNLVGQFVGQGEVLGHIINPKNQIIKAVIPQSRIGLLETYETSAEFVLADNLGSSYQSQILREAPQATTNIPSPALGVLGGGSLEVDPADKSGTKLLKPIFLIDLSLPEDLHLKQIGGRVYVRLNHGALPIGSQVYLYFNQLFLRHFYTN